MAHFDTTLARFNMIEQQIRPWDVLDQRVLDTVNAIPREQFVPDEYRRLAFSDISIPLGDGQAMMPPRLEARILQALEIKPEDHILEIGTGSGYLTACLAALGGYVTSVDIRERFTENARTRLAARSIQNVTLETGDASQGWPEKGPYDVIVVTGSVPDYREQFRKELKPGGRLLVIAGVEPIMEALLITRTGTDSWATESLFETVVPPLENCQQPDGFLF